METTTATRPGARYARISEDLARDEHGVTNQLGDEAAHAATHGITIAEGHTYVDNDISATYGKHRPGYTAMMEAAARGEFSVIIVFHTSRLWRNRKERAEGIEILRKAGISVEATKGPSLDMSTAYGRGMAGLLGEFDTMETEVKSERQVLAAQARARAGHVPVGVRSLGYTVKDDMIEGEAETVRAMFARFHAGDSLVGIARWLNACGVPTRHGGPWRPGSVRQVLANPRYKGTVVYRHRSAEPGEPVPAAFPAIVDEGTWEAVNGRLADPRRKTAFGTDRRHLGSSVYLCGVCKRPVRSHGTPTRYRCPDGHVTRTAAPVDDYVLLHIRARLARGDLAGLVAAPVGPEAAAVAAEVKSLRTRLKRTDRDYDEDLIDGKRYREKKRKLDAALGQAEARRTRLLAGSEVAAVVTAPDAVRAFDAAPLGARQAVIRFFCRVELLHVPRGSKGFDPGSVRVEPVTR